MPFLKFSMRWWRNQKESGKYVPKVKTVSKDRAGDLGVIFIEVWELMPREWENVVGKRLGLGEVGPTR